MGKFLLIFLFMFILGTAFCHYESPNIETLRQSSNNVPMEGIDDPGKNDMQKLLLKLHNDARQKVKAGQMKCANGTLPKAKSMPDLVWDKDLAKGAQNLTSFHVDAHNQDNVPSGKYATGTYGQNTNYAYQTTNAQSREMALRKSMDAWVNENTIFPCNVLDSFHSNPNGKPEWNHFTQVIWGNTTLVGCGYSNFKRGNEWHQIVACNYFVRGNIVGKNPHKVYEH